MSYADTNCLNYSAAYNDRMFEDLNQPGSVFHSVKCHQNTVLG